MSAVITAPHRQAAPAEEQPRLRIVRISRLEDLHTIEPAWQALADRAVEPNVFYEPWMMLPALRQFHAKARLEIYAVYADFLNDSRLVAFVPFEREAWAFGLRSRRRRLLRYYYCALCTPLLDREFGSDAMAELLRGLRSSSGLYEFSHVNADGPVMQAIVAALGEKWRGEAAQIITRAFLTPYASAEDYLASTFKPKKRRAMQKREDQLRQHGEVDYGTLTSERALSQWIEEFLAVEASGWKGQAATAFASVPGGADFFRSICWNAHGRGRLEMHALRLSGRPIALLCLFSAHGELAAFRTAYDEQFSRYGPGVLLAVWHSCMLHEREEVRAMDSCADPESRLDNELWLGRRRLASFQIG